MNPDPLDRQLDAYAWQALSPAPETLASGVWHEIEQRRRQSFVARLGWIDLLKRPGWALAALVFAVAAGAIPAVAFSRAQQTKRLARDSLHFEVFSPHGRGQLATVLTKPVAPHPHSP